MTLDKKYKKYLVNQNEHFTFLAFSKLEELPEKGWKIHISAYFNNYRKILKKTLEISKKYGLILKFVNNFYTFSYLVGKNCDRFSAGKFITIYFKNEQEFKKVAPLLHRTFKKEKGLYILSDIAFGESKVVYYRYGYYFEEKEKRELFQPLPQGIKDPFDNYKIKKEDAIEKTIVLNKKYLIDDVYQFSNFGGIYSSQNKYILKEARPGTGNSHIWTSLKLRKNEFILTKRLEQRKCLVAKSIEHFQEENHHFFVYEKLKGCTLSELYLFSNLFYAKDSELSKSNNQKYWKLFNEILFEVEKIHKCGVILNDISESNIFVQNEKPYFIDLEHAYLNKQRTAMDIKLEEYTDSNYLELRAKEKDYVKLYYMFISLLSGLNQYLYLDKKGNYVQKLFDIFSKYTVINAANIKCLFDLKHGRKENLNFNETTEEKTIDYLKIKENILEKLDIVNQSFDFSLVMDRNERFFTENVNFTEEELRKLKKINGVFYIFENNCFSPNLKNGTALCLIMLLEYTKKNNDFKYLALIRELIDSLAHNFSRKIDFLEGEAGIIFALMEAYEFLKEQNILKKIFYRYSFYLDFLELNKKFSIDYTENYS